MLSILFFLCSMTVVMAQEAGSVPDSTAAQPQDTSYVYLIHSDVIRFDEVKSDLRSYIDRVQAGEVSFSTLAVLYSEDPGVL